MATVLDSTVLECEGESPLFFSATVLRPGQFHFMSCCVVSQNDFEKVILKAAYPPFPKRK